jgi:hypothetical protein
MRWAVHVARMGEKLSFSRSFDLLAQGPDISRFACLSPVLDSHCFM